MIGEGEWAYDSPLPHLEPLSNPQRSETILMGWSLHDYDAPTAPVIAVGVAKIVVQNDVDEPR